MFQRHDSLTREKADVRILNMEHNDANNLQVKLLMATIDDTATRIKIGRTLSEGL